ncbi:uncharacterized protein LOC130891477 [Diorhabda carinulata]|uniref:uncharacterized protein LOC130891477 n=1 Tax=Diorhabda carinulata TaxID=1163345 RepID=UPI0025A1D176|nr:uncharacterized protein LOC130891477 [Diorhabda carinulata]
MLSWPLGFSPIIGIRHVEAFLLFLLLTIAIGMRVQLAIALVAMTDKSSSPNKDVPTYDWTNTSTLLSSFLWGYLFLQVLAGNLGRIYGTKYFLMIAMAINSILHCLLPKMSELLGSYGVMLCRSLQGISQGFFYPSIYNLLPLWSPKNEMSSIASLVFAGAPFGSIVTMPIVGYISSTWYGWPFSFYVYGGAGFLWIVIYYFYGADSPDKHPAISKEEKNYILKNVEKKEQVKLPFKKILTNLSFWTILINAVTQFWCYQTLISETPTYMNKIMKFSIDTNGLLSSLPSIASFIIMIVAGYLSDILINKKLLSVLWSRRIFNFVGCLGPGLALLTLALIPSDAINTSVAMLVISTGMQSFTVPGVQLNLMDIAPSFSGVLLGMVNSTGSFVSIFGPLSVQFIVQDQTNKSQWEIIFLIGTAMYILPAILFLFTSSVEIQDFDPAKKEAKRERMKKQSVISIISIRTVIQAIMAVVLVCKTVLVALMIGIIGAGCMNELNYMNLEDIQDNNGANRHLVCSPCQVKIFSIETLISLCSNYQNGNCTIQKVGSLKLEAPKLYGWRLTTVAIEDIINNKLERGRKIVGDIPNTFQPHDFECIFSHLKYNIILINKRKRKRSNRWKMIDEYEVLKMSISGLNVVYVPVANEEKDNPSTSVPILGVRHVQIFFLFTLLSVGVGSRVQFSVAIVAMTDNSTTTNPNVPVYEWSNKNIILSAFFWGYAVLQVIGANLARNYGAKPFLLGAMGLNTGIHFLIPFVAGWWGSYGLMVCRLIQGLVQGIFYPLLYNVIAKWIPASERSTMSSISLSGGLFGVIFAMPIAGIISSSWAGWPWSFHLYVILGILWMIGYALCGASLPSSHNRISYAERKYIEDHLAPETPELNIPWRGIFTSLPFWATFICVAGHTWVYQMIMVEMPNYFNKVMKYDMTANGLVSSSPYIASFLLLFVFGYSADYISNRNILTRTGTRKLFTLLASVVPAIAYVILSYAPDDKPIISVVMLIIAISGDIASACGFAINHIDLSPNFAGVLLGICNTVAEMLSIFGPTAVHLIVTDESDKSQWRIIFLASALSFLVSGILFLFFGSAEVQPWNHVKLNEDVSMELIQQHKEEVIMTTNC